MLVIYKVCYKISETIKVYDGYSSLRKRLFRTVTVSKQATKDDLLIAAMRAFVVTQDRVNFYLLDVYANCDGDRDEEIEDPLPVQSLKRKEGRRPAILLGLRDSENDSGTIKVYARKLNVSQSSLTIPVSTNITTEQVIKEAVARFRLPAENIDTYQLVKVTLEAGRGKNKNTSNILIVMSIYFSQRINLYVINGFFTFCCSDRNCISIR